MTTTPTPIALAQQLRALADRLERHGTTVATRVTVYAARGYACGAGDASGVRSTSTSTPTERAAEHPNQFTGVDERWTRMLTAGWQVTTGGILLIDQVMAHADASSADRAVRRPGSGHCGACGRDVPGTATDRLRSGWCDACRKAWERAGFPDRAAFERSRYADKNQPSTMHVDPTAMGTWGHVALPADA